MSRAEEWQLRVKDGEGVLYGAMGEWEVPEDLCSEESGE